MSVLSRPVKLNRVTRFVVSGTDVKIPAFSPWTSIAGSEDKITGLIAGMFDLLRAIGIAKILKSGEAHGKD